MSDDTEGPEEQLAEGAEDTGFVPTPMERLNAALEHYEVERELGEGGMALVYLARDVRHDREVAVKVLKPDLAAVIGSERFASEIKTTAQLQHPNILPLFDSGEADGYLYYVMPFVDGVTLQRRIDHERQLPVDEAVRLISEVADGLDHAHKQGIVHRDIKPANILIRDDRPVIMDFGIAIAMGAAAGARLTETGLSLGTPFYMSPEQATGERNIGPASDTYSLAAVLYEALTGEPPFMGGTAQAVLGKIVAGETASVRAARHTVPAHVDAAIQKALEKIPADRFETTGDFARALQDSGFRHGTASEPESVASAPTGTATGDLPWWNPVTIVMTLMTVLLSFALMLALTDDGDDVGAPGVHFTLLPHDGADFVGIESPGVSQDGRLIAFPARRGDTTRIQLRSLDDFAARWVEGTEDGFAPFFSPDGRWLGFFTMHEVRKVPIEGGRPTTIAQVPFLMNASAVWLPSDTIVFHQANYPGLSAVDANGGEWWQLTVPDTLAGEMRHAVPRALPDGRVLFTVRPWIDVRTRWAEGQSPAVVSPSTGDVDRIDVQGSAWAYLPGDRLLTWNSGAFSAWPFDLGSTRVDGPPSPVRTSLRGNDSCDDLRVSRSGTAVCSDQRSAGTRTLAMLDREGSEVWVSDVPGEFRWPRISPDGRHIAALGDDRFGVFDIASGNVVEIDDARSGEPTWTPDSRSVVYWKGSATGDADLWIRDRGTNEAPRQLTDDPNRSDWPTSVSPDGEVVLFYDSSDLWTVPVAGGQPTRFSETPGAWERGGVFSPDGDIIAYASDELGAWEVFLTAWPRAPGRIRVSFAGGHNPKWSPDGTEIYFVQGTRMMAAEVIRGTELRVGQARELFRGDFWVDPSGDQTFDVGPDGNFLVIQGDDLVDVRVVTGLNGAIEGEDGR